MILWKKQSVKANAISQFDQKTKVNYAVVVGLSLDKSGAQLILLGC